MNIAIYTLKSIAFAIADPYYMVLLIVLGVVFYRQNKKTTVIQKMIIGESLNSPLELTISQIVIGIFAGAVASIILSYFGVMFGENSGIEIMFLLSLLLTFLNPRFICFSYSGALLGLISIIVQLVRDPVAGIGPTADMINKSLYINIAALMTLVGVLHLVEGLLVILDGDRGAIPVFTSKEGKITGGFALKRYWAMPVALLLILNNSLAIGGEELMTPNWWPLLKSGLSADFLKTAMIAIMPFYGIIGYSSVTFTKTKKEKSYLSGIGIFIYGFILVIVAQLANRGLAWQLFVIIFAPVAHELMLNIQKYIEGKSQPRYISDEEGIMILEVAPNSPADEMGIRSGDKVLEINDTRVESEAYIYKFINKSLENIKFKIKDSKGKIKELNMDFQGQNKRMGVVLVPRNIPEQGVMVKFDGEKFNDIVNKLKNKDDNEE